MPRVFLKNNGAPHKLKEQRGPFHLPGWPVAIPLKGKLEITPQLLRTMLRNEGHESAKAFAHEIAATYNRLGQPKWLSVIVEPDPDPANTENVKAPETAQTETETETATADPGPETAAPEAPSTPAPSASAGPVRRA